MSELEEMSRDKLIVVVRQARQLAAQDQQISDMAGQLSALMEADEALAAKLARLEHLLSRNSGNSSNPPSREDDPGKPAPPDKARRRGGPKRSRGKQPGAPGSHLAWTDERRGRFPEGRCDCGDDLGGARDLGVVGRYQEHEIPQVAITITQYDQHQVACGCGRRHTATRPSGARSGPVGYGPNLAAFAVYLITLAHAVCCDETPLRVGAKTPAVGKKKAERYLLVSCTKLYTHYLLGDRSLATFKTSIVADLATSGSVIVRDRYQNYHSAMPGTLVHQLCCAHLLRDLDHAAQVYPDAVWPVQIAGALRELIHHANLARDHALPAIPDAVREEPLRRFENGVLVGLSDTTSHGTRPGERKARLLPEVLRDREGDVLRFIVDLQVPPTPNQAEGDLRPSKIQHKISGRRTSTARTEDRYTILGYISTTAKHRHDKITGISQCADRPTLDVNIQVLGHGHAGIPAGSRSRRGF